MEARLFYFEEGERRIHKATLDLVRERLDRKDIKKIVLASPRRYGQKAMETFRDSGCQADRCAPSVRLS